MSLMSPPAVHVSPHACCDRPRPYFACGQWAEIGTTILYGVCQSCGSIVAACTCGCGDEGRLVPSEVLRLARRWPDQWRQMEIVKREVVRTVTTVNVPIPRLAMFRLRDGREPRVERQEPERLLEAKLGNGRRSGSCLSTLVSHLLHRLATLILGEAPPTIARTITRADAAPGGRHE